MAATTVIAVNGAEFQQRVSGVARDQFPFAMALSLTRSAEEGVQEEIKDLPTRFHIRNSWVAKGFRVDKATKRNLIATVRHKDSYMLLQETGGVKTPTAAKSVAVPGPFKGGQGARSSIEKTTPRSKWPGRIKRRFYVQVGGVSYEYSRSGRRKGRHVKHAKKGQGRKRGKGYRDPGLKLQYVFKPSVRVKPRAQVEATLRRTVDARLALNFQNFLAFAIRTAK